VNKVWKPAASRQGSERIPAKIAHVVRDKNSNSDEEVSDL